MAKNDIATEAFFKAHAGRKNRDLPIIKPGPLVYAMRQGAAPGRGAIKIGFTDDLKKRYKAIRGGIRTDVVIPIASIPGSFPHEKLFHSVFSLVRRNNDEQKGEGWTEWFKAPTVAEQYAIETFLTWLHADEVLVDNFRELARKGLKWPEILNQDALWKDVEVEREKFPFHLVKNIECSTDSLDATGYPNTLDANQVFVFGSTIDGFHAYGAAGWAMRGDSRDNWKQDRAFLAAMGATSPEQKVGKWAIYGVGMGIQQGREGRSFAIPVVDEKKRRTAQNIVEHWLKVLWDMAKWEKRITFLVTPIGTGYHGWKTEEILELIKNRVARDGLHPNIQLPRVFQLEDKRAEWQKKKDSTG